MPRRAPSSFAQDRAEVAKFDKPRRRASLYLAPMTPRAITGKIARLITTAWPASPKKDADTRNKRGRRERAEFHLYRTFPAQGSAIHGQGRLHAQRPAARGTARSRSLRPHRTGRS